MYVNDPSTAEFEKLKHYVRTNFKSSTSIASLMEPCRRLQGARSTQVRLSQTSSALASPDLLPRSLTFEALHTTIPNVVREELALLGRPTTHMVQFTNDATIRATVPQEIDRAIYYLFLAQPPYDGISNEPSPSQPTSYVMAVGCMTEPVRYPQDQHFQNRPDVPHTLAFIAASWTYLPFLPQTTTGTSCVLAERALL